MAGIQVGGIGSGLDVNSIVTQLMSLERQPINKLQTRKTQYQAQVSAYGSLSSKMSSFQTAMKTLSTDDKFKIFTAASGDSSSFSASTTSDANRGNYAVQVTQLAQQHKLRSTAAVADSAIGEGTLTFTVGTDSFDVTVDGTTTTAETLRDAINSHASNNNLVTATVITDQNGDKFLYYTSDDSGVDKAVTVTKAVTVAGAIDNLDSASMTTVDAAQDAKAVIDGLTVKSATNKFTDALEGVTITAAAVMTSSKGLDIARDDASIKKSLQEFADSYNSLRSTIDSLRKGHLEADGTLLQIESTILKEIGTPTGIAGATYGYMSQIGLALDSSGKLQVDSDDLSTALDNDFDGVAQLFSNDPSGFAFRLEELVGNVLQTDGMIAARKDGLGDQISSMDERIRAMERGLGLTEKRIRDQFTAMDGLVAKLNTTGSFLNGLL